MVPVNVNVCCGWSSRCQSVNKSLKNFKPSLFQDQLSELDVSKQIEIISTDSKAKLAC